MSIMLQLFRLEHYYIYFMNIVEEDSGATTKSFYKSIEINSITQLSSQNSIKINSRTTQLNQLEYFRKCAHQQLLFLIFIVDGVADINQGDLNQ